MKRTRVAIDADLSERLVGALDALYGHEGFEFIYVNNMSPAGTKDVSWADVFKQWGGRIVISGDRRIATKPHQAVAFIDNGFVCFFPPAKIWGDMKGHEKAAAIIHQWPAIRRVAEGATGGSCWHFPCEGRTGDVRLIDRAMTKMEIPNDVLEATPRRRAKR